MSFPALVTATVALSGGRSAVVRRLGWKAKKAARDQQQLGAIEKQKAMGMAFMDEFRKSIEAQGGVDKLRELAAANPHLQYDPATLLYRGVVSISDIDGDPTPAQLDELSEEDADALVQKIVELSPTKTEEERKNS